MRQRGVEVRRLLRPEMARTTNNALSCGGDEGLVWWFRTRIARKTG